MIDWHSNQSRGICVGGTLGEMGITFKLISVINQLKAQILVL